jgi:hypothetical protein
MEEDLQDYRYQTDILSKPLVQKQLEALASAADEAEEIQKYDAAHNPEIQYALDIIERFLVKKQRICYGGTAINAILPKSLKFYNPEKDLPDYDFFTPDPDTDIKGLVKDLQAAGFTDVVERVGIHAGTHKILVNFLPVADMTYLQPELYKKLHKRSVVKEGIHYCDPDFLRMLMYLELSRPKGQVQRWPKVYERLVLLNAAFPPKPCRLPIETLVGRVLIPGVIRQELLRYVIDNKRILVGADVIALYDWLISKRRKIHPTVQWFLKQQGMLVFLSPEAERDANRLKEIFSSEETELKELPEKKELVPQRFLVTFRKMPLCMIVQENACHSFTTLKLHKGKTLMVGSLDTMITLYFSLAIFTEDEKYLEFLMTCLCQKLLEMNILLQKKGTVGSIPAFSIECTGYQKGFATLLKEKFQRIAREKAKRKTRSRTSPQRANSALTRKQLR